MTLLIPAVWYRTRAVIERRWGWSPVEEEVLLALRERSGTSASTAQGLGIPQQVVTAAVNRLMRYGLIEARISPEPGLTMTEAAHAHLLAGRPLPERTALREMSVSIVLDKLGGSVFRKRAVSLTLRKDLEKSLKKDDVYILAPSGEEMETDASMQGRVQDLLAPSLRSGEAFATVQPASSVIEEAFIRIDLHQARDGVFPEGASGELCAALQDYVVTKKLPRVPRRRATRPTCLDASILTTFSPETILFGGGDHLARLVEIVDRARSDVFVLSTFVADQDDPKAPSGQMRVWEALERALGRGVRIHLFYGSSLDQDRKHLRAMAALQNRLRRVGGAVAVHPASARSHAKILIADDGGDGACAVLGSCNWLQSPFRAFEISLELSDDAPVAGCLSLLEAITALIPTAREARAAMQKMRTALEKKASPLIEPPPRKDAVSAKLRFLDASSHLPLLRRVAAEEAQERLLITTHKMGAPMVQNLLDPAQTAAQRMESVVQAFYSVPTGPVKKRDIRAAHEQAAPDVALHKVQNSTATIHGKSLLWDHDDIVVTSFNWGSQSASEDKPLDEIGLHLHGPGIADALHAILVTRVDAIT